MYSLLQNICRLTLTFPLLKEIKIQYILVQLTVTLHKIYRLNLIQLRLVVPSCQC